jgi:hypothetical protein
MFAGLREILKNNKAAQVIVPAVLILAAAVLLYFQFAGGNGLPLGVSRSAYFTTDENATGDAAVSALFVDDVNKIPPFDHNGKPAYKAVVYVTSGGKKWVNHLVRYTPQMKKKLEEEAQDNRKKGIQTGPDFSSAGDGGMEVKQPGPGAWLKASDNTFAQVARVSLPSGVSAGDVDFATP